MRTTATLAAASLLALAGLLSANTARAMGTDNVFDDLQVGVTYTVYEPTSTASLKLTGNIGSPCADGSDENVDAAYGNIDIAFLTITEGNPICVEPAGDGKIVGHVVIQGRRATVVAFCDFTKPAQWRDCNARDIVRTGGSITVTLPATKGLRATKVAIVTEGATPLTYAQLLRVARGLAPANETA